MKLRNKTILITGAAYRIGRSLALAAGKEGANLILHYNRSRADAEQLQAELTDSGSEVALFQADFSSPEQTQRFAERVFRKHSVSAVINNASLFQDLDWSQTKAEDIQTHQNINLTAPFLISQAFANSLAKGEQGRIINMLDWRALRPGPDHLPYTISKAGLAALTRSLAISLGPQIAVNGVALGAILPPSSGSEVEGLVSKLPIPRWAEMDEVIETVLFLLTGPGYITGEIIHLDGGRHLL